MSGGPVRMFCSTSRPGPNNDGTLTGDTTLADAAIAALAAQRVARPDRFAAILAPGFPVA